MLLSKSDLIDVLGDFDPQRATTALRNLANPAPVISISSRDNNGMQDWITWLHAQRAGLAHVASKHHSHAHAHGHPA
jgi:hydrogenase nickel incorporation protein HypB